MADGLNANVKTLSAKDLENAKSDEGDTSFQRKYKPPFWFKLIDIFVLAILIALLSNKPKDERVAKSICHVQDIDQNCLHWTIYNLDRLKPGENSDTAGFGARCKERGWDIKIRPEANVLLFECVNTKCVTG